jgi:hypothetical protein
MFPKFRDMSELKAFTAQQGSHFFDASALRFFSSRISEDLYGGRFFVTSELDFSGSIRSYTVRVLVQEGDGLSFESVGGFQRFASRSGAHAAAKRYVKMVQVAEAYSAKADEVVQQIIDGKFDK